MAHYTHVLAGDEGRAMSSCTELVEVIDGLRDGLERLPGIRWSTVLGIHGVVPRGRSDDTPRFVAMGLRRTIYALAASLAELGVDCTVDDDGQTARFTLELWKPSEMRHSANVRDKIEQLAGELQEPTELLIALSAGPGFSDVNLFDEPHWLRVAFSFDSIERFYEFQRRLVGAWANAEWSLSLDYRGGGHPEFYGSLWLPGPPAKDVADLAEAIRSVYGVEWSYP